MQKPQGATATSPQAPPAQLSHGDRRHRTFARGEPVHIRAPTLDTEIHQCTGGWGHQPLGGSVMGGEKPRCSDLTHVNKATGSHRHKHAFALSCTHMQILSTHPTWRQRELNRVHTLTLLIHTLYSRVQAPVPPKRQSARRPMTWMPLLWGSVKPVAASLRLTNDSSLDHGAGLRSAFTQL